jgi:putative two-component system response regulator
MENEQERILIVDDEVTIRKLLVQKLSREGYHCEEADSAEQALDKLSRHPAELAILDIKMPGKSGIELLTKLRASYPDTAVVMATAINDVNIAIQCMKQGAYDYLPKPFNLEEVMLSVDRVLEKRRLELELRGYQQYLEQKVDEQTEQARKIFLSAMEALIFAVEAKDKYTAGHSRRVTQLAVAIGRQAGLSSEEIEDLQWGGLLHDVGKIAVDQAIQDKPGALTPEEYEHIMIHAHAGANIVKPVVNQRVVEMIEHHHDYYDGNGMKQVVTGEKIPLGARILAVADAFDAMTSDRPYRSAMSADEALSEIMRCSGTQFDPVVVTTLFKIPLAGMVQATVQNLPAYATDDMLAKSASGLR